MWWKKNKWKVIVPILIVAVLAGAFWYGGDAPGMQGWKVDNNTAAAETSVPSIDAAQPQSTNVPENAQTASAAADPQKTDQPEETDAPEEQERPGADGAMSVQEKLEAAAEIAGASSAGVEQGDTEYSESQGMVIDPTTGKDKYLTDPVPEGKPLPVEPQDAKVTDTAYTCTISISCATILNHMNWLDQEKVELVPADGWILPPTTVTFYEGESVFNVLQRTCKQQKIHMEFMNTPMYNSAYIEGIHNLYEFDCGELSGWMYKVNGWFPNYGCSRYALQPGDVICWEYTCDLGVDVGGYFATGGSVPATPAVEETPAPELPEFSAQQFTISNTLVNGASLWNKDYAGVKALLGEPLRVMEYDVTSASGEARKLSVAEYSNVRVEFLASADELAGDGSIPVYRFDITGGSYMFKGISLGQSLDELKEAFGGVEPTSTPEGAAYKLLHDLKPADFYAQYDGFLYLSGFVAGGEENMCREGMPGVLGAVILLKNGVAAGIVFGFPAA